MKLHIRDYRTAFEREQLKRPYVFKGQGIFNVWQTGVKLYADTETSVIGLGVQSPLWCDGRVATRSTENGSNAMMFAMTERALQMIKGQTFDSPLHLQDTILDELWSYGQKITGQADLKKTFALNPLVPVDNAAWLLYARQNNLTHFDQWIPEAYKPGLSARHDRVACIPALSFGIGMDEIKTLADQGFFILKIKIGGPGDRQTMLENDKKFIQSIHQTIGHYETAHTPDGKLPYYFDANGRYESLEDVHRLFDFAEKIGALGQIKVLEEPFADEFDQRVHELTTRGPRLAADESAHTVEHTLDRIDLGYNAIAVKSIAKTMSMTMRIAQAAFERGIPCFCADLTVNPLLVEWNKIIAARLPAFPGWNMGLQEANGWQNYRDWPALVHKYHPAPQASWIYPQAGVFETGAEFFSASGGIFGDIPYWSVLLK